MYTPPDELCPAGAEGVDEAGGAAAPPLLLGVPAAGGMYTPAVDDSADGFWVEAVGFLV
jgi:hypothetical protein